MSIQKQKESLQQAKRLIEFIDQSPSPFHVVANSMNLLKNEGYEELSLERLWKIRPGGKYYISRHSALFAFQVGSGQAEEHGIRLISSHSDSPCFKVKPSCEMSAEGYYRKINTEVYGGPILSTWMDRPLSLAGRVLIKSGDPLWPVQKLVNIDRPTLVIPNMAIHFNRSVNEGFEFNKQIDMLPLAGISDNATDKDDWLTGLLAEDLEIAPSSIIDYDLFVYPYEAGCILGLNDEFISSPRLDNLAMVHASLTALCSAKPTGFTQMICIFDNEEVGSVSKQGAGAPILKHVVERLMHKLDKNQEELQMAIYKSFMISADMAHSVHPNHPEKHDPVLHPHMNNGPVIKIHAGQKYTSDGDSAAVYATICETAGVPFQKFVNRSDMAGGSTLGNISTSQLDIRTVDVGNPMLAMHSAREIAGTMDHLWIIESFDAFFAE
ncbi:MAG: M18 family aminopeptidase [Breznakibacter sp.]